MGNIDITSSPSECATILGHVETWRSTMGLLIVKHVVLLVGLAACGGTPHATTPVTQDPPATTTQRTFAPDPDLERPPRAKLLAIDWSTVRLTSDAEAIALWSKLSITSNDWHDKLEEVPNEFDRPLAVALLREGNFNCVPARAAGECVPPVFDIPEPQATAGLADPCFRRLVALWAIEQLEAEDVAIVFEGLKKIAALPPPESQLTAAALKVVPDNEPARRLELISIAYRAGQRDLANAALGTLDEKFLVEAVTTHHVDGALEMLPVSTHRATFLAAIGDDKLPTKARTTAIAELADDKLAPDLRTALAKVTTTADCAVAASAARVLVQNGEPKFAPKRPRTTAIAPMMRALCVLASYERLQASDEPSLLPGYLPAKGLERIKVSYDSLSDTDPDGDGNLKT
ncbi:MAG: hypothetical protein H0V17_29800, partial [Deltaproteobacteria bacterium]|nr:hypothetical protein [Deltaproteobacteria bacterium]